METEAAPNMSGEREFFKTHGFWITAVATVLIVTVVAVVIYVFDERTAEFCWTGECFNNLIDIYTVPLGIGSVGLAVLALLSYNHRSAQSARSMELQEKQNRFSNYYNHLSNFRAIAEEYIIRHPKSEGKKRAALVVAHVFKKIYPDASPQSDEYLVSNELEMGLENARRELARFMALLPSTLERGAPIDPAYITDNKEAFSGLVGCVNAIGHICYPNYKVGEYTLEDRVISTRTSVEMLNALIQFEVVDDRATRIATITDALERDLSVLQKNVVKLGFAAVEFKKCRYLVASEDHVSEK